MTCADKEKLLALLDEDDYAATQRVNRYLDRRFRADRPTILFGAGNTGRAVASNLASYGLTPSCFMDDTPAKTGSFLEGIPVVSREEALSRYGTDVNLVVTILNPNHRFKDTLAAFRGMGVEAIPFMGLTWFNPEWFEGGHGVTRPDRILRAKSDIVKFFDLLSDAKSEKEYVAQIEFRLSLNFDVLTPRQGDIYFAEDVPLAFGPNLTFLDGGAYDGDTVEMAWDRLNSRIEKIIAFEPDAANFRTLVARVDQLGIRDVCELHETALGARRERVSFNATGDMSAALSAGGAALVDVEPLAPYITSNMYMKFDIEGAEAASIGASLSEVVQFKPAIACSVYHRPADLWEIGLQLHHAVPEYKFFIRNHGVDSTDVVCYALPSG